MVAGAMVLADLHAGASKSPACRSLLVQMRSHSCLELILRLVNRLTASVAQERPPRSSVRPSRSLNVPDYG